MKVLETYDVSVGGIRWRLLEFIKVPFVYDESVRGNIRVLEAFWYTQKLIPCEQQSRSSRLASLKVSGSMRALGGTRMLECMRVSKK